MNRDSSERIDGTTSLWILHFAFMASIPIHAVVAWFLLRPIINTAVSTLKIDAWLFSAIFAMISIMSALGGFVMPSVIEAKVSSAEVVRRITPLERLRTRQIISDALFESIAVYGLVSVVLGINIWFAFGLMFFSLALLAINTGRIAGWIEEHNSRLRLESENH